MGDFEIEFRADPARQEAANRYAATSRRLYFLELSLGAIFGLWLILTGIGIQLRDELMRVTDQQSVLVALMLLVLSLGYTLILWPISFYKGFRLPQAFGLSTQAFRGWLADWAKGGIVGLVLALVIVEIVYYLLGAFPSQWWWLTAIALLGFTVVLANLAPILLLPLFYELTPLDNEELARRLVLLAERAGARVRGVFTMNMSSKTTAANAALMGIGNTRRVVLGDTLLSRYDADEIETVLAHELGHHVHGDIPKGIVLQSALTLVGLYTVDIVLRWGGGIFGFAGPADVASMPLLALAIGVFGVLTMPLTNAFSRHIEAQADRYALESTCHPVAFARVMAKLADQNLSEMNPPRWVEMLLHDHPATARRVQAAHDFRNRS